jgi:hypothetical protein
MNSAGAGPDGAGAVPRFGTEPTGATLYGVVHQLDEAGWTGQFQAVEGGVLRCLTCRAEFPAAAEHADEMVRVEGVSDPDDMAVVIPLRCPRCTTRGTFVAHYGPGAGVEEAEVLVVLERQPDAAGDGIADPERG